MRVYFLARLDEDDEISGAESREEGDITDYKPLFLVHHGGVTDTPLPGRKAGAGARLPEEGPRHGLSRRGVGPQPRGLQVHRGQGLGVRPLPVLPLLRHPAEGGDPGEARHRHARRALPREGPGRHAGGDPEGLEALHRLQDPGRRPALRLAHVGGRGLPVHLLEDQEDRRRDRGNVAALQGRGRGERRPACDSTGPPDGRRPVRCPSLARALAALSLLALLAVRPAPAARARDAERGPRLRRRPRLRRPGQLRAPDHPHAAPRPHGRGGHQADVVLRGRVGVHSVPGRAADRPLPDPLRTGRQLRAGLGRRPPRGGADAGRGPQGPGLPHRGLREVAPGLGARLLPHRPRLRRVLRPALQQRHDAPVGAHRAPAATCTGTRPRPTSSRSSRRTLTRRYTEEAVRFIRASKGGPFFVYLPHSMPHLPVSASEDFAGPVPGRPLRRRRRGAGLERGAAAGRAAGGGPGGADARGLHQRQRPLAKHAAADVRDRAGGALGRGHHRVPPRGQGHHLRGRPAGARPSSAGPGGSPRGR